MSAYVGEWRFYTSRYSHKIGLPGVHDVLPAKKNSDSPGGGLDVRQREERSVDGWHCFRSLSTSNICVLQ